MLRPGMAEDAGRQFLEPPTPAAGLAVGDQLGQMDDLVLQDALQGLQPIRAGQAADDNAIS
jgi:hypothetical protein